MGSRADPVVQKIPQVTRIGLIADSHDHHDHIRQAMGIFRAHAVDQVIHAGDFINPGSILLLEGIPLLGVFGNNDGDRLNILRAYQRIGGEIPGEFAELTIQGRRLGVYHGTEPAIKRALIASGQYRILIFGHTHRAESRWEGETLVLNPGTCHGFGSPATVMILDLSAETTELIPLGPSI